MTNHTRLSLTFEIESRNFSLELNAGSHLVLGRSANVDINVDESSVSSEHLKITFTGTLVRIEDLGSTNGTFRLPNEAPFVVAEFSAVPQTLSLRLGFETEVKLSWLTLTGAKVADLTKTAFEPAARTPGDSVVKVESKTATALAGAAGDPAVKVSAETTSIVPSVHSPAYARKQTSSYFKVFALMVYSAAVLALSKTLWQSDLGFVYRVTKGQRGVGLGIDILAVSLSGYAQRGWLILVLSLLLTYGFYRFWIRSVSNGKLKAALILWSVVVSGWPLAYPFVLAARNGVGMKHLNALRSSDRIFESSAYTLDEKSEKFATLLPDLQGSSYFYAKVVNLFFEKVIDECGGAWKDDWNKKKLCLVLINSVTVESLTDMRPQVLHPVALRLVLITSLDSILRIFPVEGPASEMNEVFIKSVESVGLKEEAKRIRNVMTSTKTTPPQKFDALQKLKMTVEMRLDSLNVELKVPEVMRVNAPDILALGI